MSCGRVLPSARDANHKGFEFFFQLSVMYIFVYLIFPYSAQILLENAVFCQHSVHCRKWWTMLEILPAESWESIWLFCGTSVIFCASWKKHTKKTKTEILEPAKHLCHTKSKNADKNGDFVFKSASSWKRVVFSHPRSQGLSSSRQTRFSFQARLAGRRETLGTRMLF